MATQDEGFHVIGYDLRGNQVKELRASSVTVTANLNSPDMASIELILDEDWGPPGPPNFGVSALGGPLSLLQPWAACIGVFDAETDHILFYGPITRRRRAARKTGAKYLGETVSFECSSWDYWLDFVYPELDLVYGAAHDQRGDLAVEKVLWGGLFDTDPLYPGEWAAPGLSPAQTPEAEIRGSVAGRAGVAFGFMPLPRHDLAHCPGVYLDWATTGPGRLGQTSASSLISEVVEQGNDFYIHNELNPGTLKVLSLAQLNPVPPITQAPSPSSVTFVAGGNVTAATISDRGDLFASLVRVTGGSGDAGESPKLAHQASTALLVERARPYQRSGGSPGVTALELRAATLRGMLFPSPVEFSEVQVRERLPYLLPGAVATFVAPVGVDLAAGGQPWDAVVRVQSVTWGSDVAGCQVTLVEPGSDAAVSMIPRPTDFVSGLSATRQDVTGLMSR